MILNFLILRSQSTRNNNTTFRGQPTITFLNKETRQVAIFDRETKLFITAYKISKRNIHELTTGNIGNDESSTGDIIDELSTGDIGKNYYE